MNYELNFLRMFFYNMNNSVQTNNPVRDYLSVNWDNNQPHPHPVRDVSLMDGLIVNLPFQGVINIIFTLAPRLRRWAEITFGLQPISEKVNMHALKAQYNSARWQRLGEYEQ